MPLKCLNVFTAARVPQTNRVISTTRTDKRGAIGRERHGFYAPVMPHEGIRLFQCARVPQTNRVVIPSSSTGKRVSIG